MAAASDPPSGFRGSWKYLCGAIFSPRLNWRGSESRAAGNLLAHHSLYVGRMDALVSSFCCWKAKTVLIAERLAGWKSDQPIYRENFCCDRRESTDQREQVSLTAQSYLDGPTSKLLRERGKAAALLRKHSVPRDDERVSRSVYRAPHGLGGAAGKRLLKPRDQFFSKLSNIRLQSVSSLLTLLKVAPENSWRWDLMRRDSDQVGDHRPNLRRMYFDVFKILTTCKFSRGLFY